MGFYRIMTLLALACVTKLVVALPVCITVDLTWHVQDLNSYDMPEKSMHGYRCGLIRHGPLGRSLKRVVLFGHTLMGDLLDD